LRSFAFDIRGLKPMTIDWDSALIWWSSGNF